MELLVALKTCFCRNETENLSRRFVLFEVSIAMRVALLKFLASAQRMFTTPVFLVETKLHSTERGLHGFTGSTGQRLTSIIIKLYPTPLHVGFIVSTKNKSLSTNLI